MTARALHGGPLGPGMSVSPTSQTNRDEKAKRETRAMSCTIDTLPEDWRDYCLTYVRNYDAAKREFGCSRRTWQYWTSGCGVPSARNLCRALRRNPEAIDLLTGERP